MMKFSDYTKGFRNSMGPRTNPKLDPPKSAEPGAKRRQLAGQIAGITQELVNLPTLTDTDRRLLNLSSAVSLLLAGAR
jgi:hypothetical protein